MSLISIWVSTVCLPVSKLLKGNLALVTRQ
jgi:hypothetical protein